MGLVPVLPSPARTVPSVRSTNSGRLPPVPTTTAPGTAQSVEALSPRASVRTAPTRRRPVTSTDHDRTVLRCCDDRRGICRTSLRTHPPPWASNRSGRSSRSVRQTSALAKSAPTIRLPSGENAKSRSSLAAPPSLRTSCPVRGSTRRRMPPGRPIATHRPSGLAAEVGLGVGRQLEAALRARVRESNPSQPPVLGEHARHVRAAAGDRHCGRADRHPPGGGCRRPEAPDQYIAVEARCWPPVRGRTGGNDHPRPRPAPKHDVRGRSALHQ